MWKLHSCFLILSGPSLRLTSLFFLLLLFNLLSWDTFVILTGTFTQLKRSMEKPHLRWLCTSFNTVIKITNCHSYPPNSCF